MALYICFHAGGRRVVFRGVQVFFLPVAVLDSTIALIGVHSAFGVLLQKRAI